MPKRIEPTFKEYPDEESKFKPKCVECPHLICLEDLTLANRRYYVKAIRRITADVLTKEGKTPREIAEMLDIGVDVVYNALKVEK